MIKKLFGIGILLCLTVLSACLQHPEQPPNPEKLYADGQTLYLEYCAECHQIDGSGFQPLYPNFAGNPLITLHEPEPIIVIVMYGQGSMPAFNDKLKKDEIAAILTYIRGSWGNNATAVSPRQIQ